MRLRNIPGSREAIAENPLVIKNAKEKRGCWAELFGNTNPVHLEIGMGKGRFMMELAAKHPEINYVGVEMYSSVMIRALQKAEQLEKPLPNLLFLCEDARELPEMFAEGEVDKIYLNFSDPWPKDRHADRRLTSPRFLNRFSRFLKADGLIEFKTDNKGLFDYSVEQLEPAGWEALLISYDLHADEELMKENIMTEYEEKFSSKGNPIFKYVIKKKEI